VEAVMKLEMRRVILFTRNMEAMSRFYRDIIGLDLVTSEDGWMEFDAGTCNLALHRGDSTVGKRAPKLAFYASDVAAAREALIRRGAETIGKVKSTGAFDLCDGADPDGNPFQLSGRN
jgi:catechol 2,3-dioxygenase-like lactoylglutathione lyase family enzyme